MNVVYAAKLLNEGYFIDMRCSKCVAEEQEMFDRRQYLLKHGLTEKRGRKLVLD